jgi:hypothetical protein
LSYLDDRTRRMMRSTSTDWAEIINYDQFTIYFMRPSTIPALVKTFSRYNKPIGLTFAKTIGPIDKSYTMLGALTNLTMLQVEPRKFIRGSSNFEEADLLHFTALTDLHQFSVGVFNLFSYLRNFTNLTRLEAPSSFYNLTADLLDDMQYLTKLRHFGMSLPYNAKDSIDIIAKLGKSTALKTLELEDDQGFLKFEEESVAQMSNLSKVSIGCRDVLFPFNKLPNLESLWISSDRFADFSVNTKLTFLSIEARGTKRIPPKISATNHDYQQLTALTNLRQLSLHLSLKDHQFSFLKQLTQLEDLYVAEKGIIGLTGHLLSFVNSSKLTRLHVPSPKSMAHLSHLTNLQEIQFSYASAPEGADFTLTSVTNLLASNMSIACHFPNIKRLRWFDPSHTPDLSNHTALSSLSHLEALYLSTIDNPTLQLLTAHVTLTELRFTVDNNTASAYDFEGLEQLTALKILGLSDHRDGHRLNCAKLWQSIAKLSNLESLKMFHINEASIEVLEGLPNLKFLDITGPEAQKFASEFPFEAKLSRLTDLQTLTLSRGFASMLGDLQYYRNLNLPYLYSCTIEI